MPIIEQKLRKSKYGTYYASGAPAHRVMDKMRVTILATPDQLRAQKASEAKARKKARREKAEAKQAAKTNQKSD